VDRPLILSSNTLIRPFLVLIDQSLSVGLGYTDNDFMRKDRLGENESSQSLGALSCMLISLSSSDVSRIFLVFNVVLLSQYIRCNDKATVSACMSLVCLAHRLYTIVLSPVYLN